VTRAEIVRGGAWYCPTQAQRVQLELARLSFHRQIERLRIARVVRSSPNVLLLQRAAERASDRRFSGAPPQTWFSQLEQK
jgi:hypothetical protein